MPSEPPIIQELFDLQKYAIKLGLDNVRFLCNGLNNPQNAYPVIHVAGTNGKGSTSFFIAALLQEYGLKVGLFTSPHLVDFRERVRVNGVKVPLDFISKFWQSQKKIIHQREATFFDTSAALAFDYFREQKVNVAVIETGLGGRLDSTNIVQSEIAVITPIDFDHENQLGHSLGAIASEKAGIIKTESIVFSAQQQPEALESLKNKIGIQNRFLYAPDFLDVKITQENLDHTVYDIQDKLNQQTFHQIQSRQLGGFQAENQVLACSVSQYFLNQRGNSLTETSIRKIFKQHIWPGRLQQMSQNPLIYFDVSHNAAGIKRTLDFLSRHIPQQKLNILVGLVADKDYNQIAATIAGVVNEIVVCEPDTHRRMDAKQLGKTFERLGKTTGIIKDSREAYEICKNRLADEQVLLVIGSHYLIGSLLAEGN